MLRIDLIIDARASLGEGPLWDVDEQRLYWIDSLGNKVHRCDAEGSERRSWDVPEHIGSMALRRQGGAVVSLRDGFYTLDLETGVCEQIADTNSNDPRIRLNDGKVDRQGRFVAGSMDYGESEPLASLWRLDPDHSVHKLEDGIICSNGPCWSVDGKTFYFADSYTKSISAYNYDTATGAISGKRTFCDFKNAGLHGFPDGATVDSEDHVWSVEVYAGRLVRFAPDGSLDRVVQLPIAYATSVIFGGPDLDIAYVTSMARTVPGRGAPLEQEAGGVFAVYGLGVTGVPEPRYAG
jgi:sugar lactone lactonase YvrE